MSSHKRYLTYRDVAEALGISVATAKRHVASGDIPAIKIGSVVRIPASALDSLEAKAYVDSLLDSVESDAYVNTLLEQAPKLTDEQRNKLAELLKPVRR